ncbi:hypothetical protein [Kaistia granuli]|uniref:hypothetical protein n=1 Tax=Kaistia granuli TaxID=363259 RepID=UPI00037F00C5|nr:hypothetical protein [Kaistia granuli]
MSLTRSMPGRGRPLNWKWISVAIAAVGVVFLLGANAHLVYVALESQPECVPHAKAADGSGDVFRAAKSAC